MSQPASHLTDIDRARIAHARQQYMLGFGLSLVTTLTAYLLAVHHVLAGWNLAYAVVALAVAQVIIQLVCFLHIGHENEPRWNLLVLDFTLIVVVIVVIGSLWIMNHLNYHMSPQDTNNYLIKDEGYQTP